MELSTIPEAVAAIKAGKAIIVADDENRENEGDIIFSAELASPELLTWTVKHSSGFICAPISHEIADTLDLKPMVSKNQDVRGTAYTVSVDATEGVSTGISASDRAKTLNVLANPNSKASDLNRPGHIIPLRAVSGGVLERAGHTEAAIEFMRLAGLREVAAICEIVQDNGEMMRLNKLLELGHKDNVPVVTIEQLIAYLEENNCQDAHPTHNSRRVSLRAETTVPTKQGKFKMRAYLDRLTGIDHIAIISDKGYGDTPAIRMHSECLTGEAFNSLKCECGPQLEAAMAYINDNGGIVIYLRGHEGRGIGLTNKLRAYALQEQGFDTLEANIKLGFEGDMREYGAAIDILKELGINKVKLLSNNPDKADQLRKGGIEVAEMLPLIVGVGENNTNYLNIKRDKMGHVLPQNLDDNGNN